MSQSARESYQQKWRRVQTQFVGDPRGAVANADSADGRDSTEDPRQAMRHYRALFDEPFQPMLLTSRPRANRPLMRERAADARGDVVVDDGAPPSRRDESDESATAAFAADRATSANASKPNATKATTSQRKTFASR